jgi:hypothetical protein
VYNNVLADPLTRGSVRLVLSVISVLMSHVALFYGSNWIITDYNYARN